MAPETQAGERYATQVGELWTGLSQTLARSRRLPSRQTRSARPTLSTRCGASSTGCTRRASPSRTLASRGCGAGHSELAAALAGARDHRRRARGGRRARKGRAPTRWSTSGAAPSSASGSPGCGSAPAAALPSEPAEELRKLRRTARRLGADGRRRGGVRGRRDRRPVAALGRRDARGLRLAARLPAVGRFEPGERLLAPEQLEALEEPRRELRAGDREPDRLRRPRAASVRARP